jgi:hypothetical protein
VNHLEPLFDLLFQSSQVNRHAADLVGRSLSLELGIVTDTNDPEGYRRIKVTTASKGGQTNSYWCLRILQSPYDDPVMPEIGQTALIGCLEGNPHAPFYLGVLANAVNPSLGKTDIVKDDHRRIPGDRVETVLGDKRLSIEGSDRDSVGQDRKETIGTDWLQQALARMTLSAAVYASLKTPILDIWAYTVLRGPLQLAIGISMLPIGANKGGLFVQPGIPGISPDKIMACLMNGNGVYQMVEVASGDSYNPALPTIPDTYIPPIDNSVQDDS